MGKPLTFQTDGWLLTNTTFRAFVNDDQTGVAMLPGAVTAIAYTVKESVGAQQTTQTGAGALSPVATYILNPVSLVSWSIDNIGYNFQVTLPASCFPDAGDYVVDFLLTLPDGSTFPIKCYHHAKSRS